MCLRKKSSIDNVEPVETETIKDAVRADASVQKANRENRVGTSALVSENIRTTNNGLDDDIVSSKKKLLGE